MRVNLSELHRDELALAGGRLQVLQQHVAVVVAILAAKAVGAVVGEELCKALHLDVHAREQVLEESIDDTLGDLAEAGFLGGFLGHFHGHPGVRGSGGEDGAVGARVDGNPVRLDCRRQQHLNRRPLHSTLKTSLLLRGEFFDRRPPPENDVGHRLYEDWERQLKGMKAKLISLIDCFGKSNNITTKLMMITYVWNQLNQ